jgi:hypothetical protein
MWHVLDEICREYQNTNFISEYLYFENSAVYEIMWRILYSRQTPITIWRMRISCWIPKATDTNSQYVQLTAFHYNSCTNAPPCYVLSTLAVLLVLSFVGTLWAVDSKLWLNWNTVVDVYWLPRTVYRAVRMGGWGGVWWGIGQLGGKSVVLVTCKISSQNTKA